MRLKFTLSAFNAFQNILACYLTWPVSHSCALAGISVLSCLIIWNEDSEMSEDLAFVHLQGSCSESMGFRPQLFLILSVTWHQYRDWELQEGEI